MSTLYGVDSILSCIRNLRLNCNYCYFLWATTVMVQLLPAIIRYTGPSISRLRNSFPIFFFFHLQIVHKAGRDSIEHFPDLAEVPKIRIIRISLPSSYLIFFLAQCKHHSNFHFQETVAFFPRKYLSFRVISVIAPNELHFSRRILPVSLCFLLPSIGTITSQNLPHFAISSGSTLRRRRAGGDCA